LFLDLLVAFLFDVCLGDILIIYRVDHALSHLENPLDDEVLVNEEHVSETAFASSCQACNVLLFDDLAAADLRNERVQIRI